MKARDIVEILRRMPDLPDSGYIPIPAAAAHDGVSVKTVRRCYPLVQLTERIRGVPISYLRHRKPAA